MKKLLLALATITCVTSPIKAGVGTIEDHKYLIGALETVGVTVKVNENCSQGYMGYYTIDTNIIQICQQNRHPIFEKEVEWTEEDYDTLRHEAHHALQDCVAGTIDDNMMGYYFADDKEFKEYIATALTEREINIIITTYTEFGATEEVLKRELEAFAVAKTTNARTIGETIIKLCQ